jgi:hypothetical protein
MSLIIELCPLITPAAFRTLDKLSEISARYCAPGVEEAANAKIAENKARKLRSMEALDGGTRIRRFKKNKKTRRK